MASALLKSASVSGRRGLLKTSGLLSLAVGLPRKLSKSMFGRPAPNNRNHVVVIGLGIGGRVVSCLFLLLTTPLVASWCGAEDLADQSSLGYEIELTKASSGYDRQKCWVHARPGAIPPQSPGNPGDTPIVVITTQKLRLDRSDVFFAIHDFRTDDLAQTWDGPRMHQTLDRREPEPGIEVVPCDFWPTWHAATGKLLGTGKTFYYTTHDQHHLDQAPSEPAYAVYDPATRSWSAWKTLQLPNDPKFENASAGCAQRYDLPNGDILLPIYYRHRDARDHRVTICRCRFDGQTLHFVEHGDELKIPTVEQHGDGFSESSLTKFGDRFFLTLRAFEHAYVATSEDGLHFDTPRRWTFDDGEDLGNYNTQQHWVTHSDGLYLVYNRRGANNDHIIRHRAPLFMGQVNPKRLCVVRSTERVLVPERGARLGNFGVVDVSPQESWVVVAEWMQTKAPRWFDSTICEQYGSDNSIFVAKIKWNRPNLLLAGAGSAVGVSTVSTTPALNTPPQIERLEMFRGKQYGYLCYRNPSLVTTSRGTILAFCEARKNTCHDWDDIDIVMRRSFDNGKSWTKQVVVIDDGTKTCGNACPVVDQNTGTIWMPFCKVNQDIFVTCSIDDGASWSEPVEITNDVKEHHFDYVGTGPGHAIQLRSGRMLVPCWADLSAGPEGPTQWRPSLPTSQFKATEGKFDLSELSWAFYSDDHGATWQPGGALDLDTTEECCLLETADGSVYMNMRWFKKTFRRGYAWSRDGGETWSPVKFDDSLYDPRCEASLVRFTDNERFQKTRVLFCNPAGPPGRDLNKERSHLTVRISYDECQTWTDGKVIDKGPSGYSDLAVAPNKTILCIYNVRPQRRTTGKSHWEDGSSIALAKFNLEWLTNGEDVLRPK